MALLMGVNSLLLPWVESIDISSAVLFGTSDEALYVTGTTMLVDAGSDWEELLPVREYSDFADDVQRRWK